MGENLTLCDLDNGDHTDNSGCLASTTVESDCSRRKWMCGVTCPVCPRREEKGSRVSRKDCSLYSHRCRIQEHRNNMRYIYVLL
ncbi:PREDICTED: uncharacterized protein LOC109387176 isoform X3 [Hipposideros armiger]|uniref:Uncharacterized protein LOC109387176 isoform X3 n=1 Tax=Hipposideros armiger TaxID=186990 RepID=A0A8B7S1F1_HIPAR|nr:PREDICTED: uncharacterized protein LOC109387176 isoform X3 [Hipposideros armiger]